MITRHITAAIPMLSMAKGELVNANRIAPISNSPRSAELKSALENVTAALDSLRGGSTGPTTTIDIPVAPTPIPRITLAAALNSQREKPTPSTPASESEPSKE
ncbi:MAG: hypothetical protein ABS95_02505 [Verrucomicrobia bacterium SCN 57-15]|nr:MAG: hypothetical protein ABS95_02505 [Verrucomicrobia bacterium SCN 57-15]